VFHLAHPSPERKWQLDRFGRLCRAYCSVTDWQSVGQNVFCLTRPILLCLDSFLGDRFSPYAIGPLSVLSVLSVCLFSLSVLSVTLVYCGQTVGRIEMKLGMQVDLGLATLC